LSTSFGLRREGGLRKDGGRGRIIPGNLEGGGRSDEQDKQKGD